MQAVMQPLLSANLDEWERRMQRFQARWERNLEAEALECSYADAQAKPPDW